MGSMRNLWAILALIAVASVLAASIGDVGPGPDPSTLPYVRMNVKLDGQPVPDTTQVEVACHVSGEDHGLPTTTLSCEGGVCENSGWYKLSPCVDSDNATAVFTFHCESFPQDYSTEPLPVKGGWTHGYLVEIGSESGDVNVTHFAPEPNKKDDSTCPALFILLGLLGSAGIALAARGR